MRYKYIEMFPSLFIWTSTKFPEGFSSMYYIHCVYSERSTNIFPFFLNPFLKVKMNDEDAKKGSEIGKKRKIR